ncbi:MAG TPA: DNA polymerase III subunit delta [Verrucomicrobiae bacterium]|nr:DNA polymerase III subunit delta [Verrucomicrobiae bacterium]
MLSYIFGPNTFIIHSAIEQLIQSHPAGELVKLDGETLEPSGLPEVFQGQSLFAQHRLVILKSVNANAKLWQALEQWIDRIPEDTHIVIVAPHPDKRTKTHKALLKKAHKIEANELTEQQAIEWVAKLAEAAGKKLSSKAARLLVERVGTDQWQLRHAFEKLLLSDAFDEETIKKIIEAVPQANAFAVLDALLAKKSSELTDVLAVLKTSEDPYRFFGLLAQQLFQLALVGEAPQKSADEIAKAIDAHPYPIKKMQASAKRLSPQEIKQMLHELVRLDDQLKTSSGEPWLLIEKALYKMMP